ncbi:MAG: DNA-binding protein [Acidimicrobiia bacterium]
MADTVFVREGLVEAAVDGPRLRGGWCGACGRAHFPASTVCPYCASDEATVGPLSPKGTLWAWTAVTAPPPGYRGEVPYGFGVVELPEGVRVVTRLTEADPQRLRFGQPVHTVVVPLATDEEGRTVLTYAFEPEGA